MLSLNKLAGLRRLVLKLRLLWLNRTSGVDAHEEASISLSATLVGAVTIGSGSLVAFKSLLIARKTDGSIDPIHIGENCFIGGGSTILPGVTIGDGTVIGAGSVVFENIPPRCIAVGNPARVLSENISAGRFGRFNYADENEAKYYKKD